MANRYEMGFRLDATRLLVERADTQADAARRLGVAVTSIKVWTDQFNAHGEQRSAVEFSPSQSLDGILSKCKSEA